MELEIEGFNGRRIILLEMESGCLTCMSHRPKGKDKPVSVRVNGKEILLKKVVFENAFGIIEGNAVINLICGDPLCLNVQHMELEMIIRLTGSQVRLIRASGDTQKQLAQRYGVSIMSISNIKNFKTWRKV